MGEVERPAVSGDASVQTPTFRSLGDELLETTTRVHQDSHRLRDRARAARLQALDVKHAVRRTRRSICGPILAMADNEPTGVADDTQFGLIGGLDDDAVFVLDADGVVLSWNAGARRTSGYDDVDVIGRHFSTFFTKDDIDDGRPDRLLGTARRRGRASDDGWRVSKDGSRFWADVTLAALFDGDGDVRAYVKVARDRPQGRTGELDADVINRIFRAGLVIHLVRATLDDDALRHRMDEAVHQLDLAIKEIRTALVDQHRTGGAGPA